MGLDMYAYSVDAGEVGDKQVDIEVSSLHSVDRNFFYWRKFNALHGWMEDLYRAKGGEDESFNCSTVRLMPEDLLNLKNVLAALLIGDYSALPPRTGFFFGPGEIYPEDISSLSDFIAKAETALNEGKAILYDSWW